MTTLSPKRFRALVEEAGFNASLPSAVFNREGDLLTANSRMLDLLGLTSRKAPVPVGEIRNLWPFSNEESAGPKVFEALILPIEGGRSSSSMLVEARLKTFKLSQKKVPKTLFKVVVAELVRSGDLLNDRDSRQNLFRTLSHEIRTAVAAFKGYTAMLKAPNEEQEKILERMKTSLERLEKVVHRLDEFKVELQLNDKNKS